MRMMMILQTVFAAFALFLMTAGGGVAAEDAVPSSAPPVMVASAAPTAPCESTLEVRFPDLIQDTGDDLNRIEVKVTSSDIPLGDESIEADYLLYHFDVIDRSELENGNAAFAYCVPTDECLSVRVNVEFDEDPAANATQTLSTEHISITVDGEGIAPGAPIFYDGLFYGYVSTTEVGDCEFPCPSGSELLDVAYFTGSTMRLTWSVLDENLVSLFDCQDNTSDDRCYLQFDNHKYRFRTCLPSSGCHHFIARDSELYPHRKDPAFSFNVTFGSEAVASWDRRFHFESISFGGDCAGCQEDESLVEIYWDRDRTEASYPEITWSLDEEAAGSVLGGTLAWNDTQLKYYRGCIAAPTCATFRASVPETYDILAERYDGSFENETYRESNAVNVRVDGVIFAQKYELGSYVEKSPFAFSLPIGECSLEHAICDSDSEHALDVSVTTGEDVYVGYYGGTWQVQQNYEDYGYGSHDRTVFDSREIFGRSLSAHTTYRTYQCLPKTSTCTELFLEVEGVEAYAIRLDGKVLDRATERTHLFGDCEDSSLTQGEIIGIVGGALVGFFALIIFAGRCRRINAGDDAETAKEADGSKSDDDAEERETEYEI